MAGWPVIVIASPGAGGTALAPVLERLREQAADVLIVGPGGTAPWAAAAIEIPVVEEPLAPIPQIIPLQQLAMEMGPRPWLRPRRTPRPDQGHRNAVDRPGGDTRYGNEPFGHSGRLGRVLRSVIILTCR